MGESLLGLNLFKRVDCYFRDFSYHVTADQCNSMSLSWLNKICVLEHSFNPLPELNTLKRSVGFVIPRRRRRRQQPRKPVVFHLRSVLR